ncbi:MAG TPA: BBP7 family outer membrane beta-barrel protein, partial [Pirellulaceae bacterium]
SGFRKSLGHNDRAPRGQVPRNRQPVRRPAARKPRVQTRYVGGIYLNVPERSVYPTAQVSHEDESNPGWEIVGDSVPEPLPAGVPAENPPGVEHDFELEAPGEVFNEEIEDYDAADLGYEDSAGPPLESCEPCGGPFCTPCCMPRFPRGLSVHADYLFWWSDGLSSPALVTTSPNGTARDDAGVLSEPGTQVLYGGDGLNDNLLSGGLITVGYWFCPCECTGLEVTFLSISGNDPTTFDSLGNPILARPFFNTQTGLEDAELIAFPDFVSGSMTVIPETHFSATDVMIRQVVSRRPCSRLHFLGGYRFAGLDERLAFDESLLTGTTNTGVPSGTRIRLTELFDTRNDFNGPQAGLSGTFRRRRASWDLVMKLAFGSTRSETLIAGATTITTPDGTSTTNQGGLLALPSNIGRFTDRKFAMMPEIGIRWNYQWNRRWSTSIGYSLVYLSQVARPGDQIDRNLNLSQLPPDTLAGAARPEFQFKYSDFTAQGLSLGLELAF